MGLSEAEAAQRLEKFGLNRIVKPRETRFLSIAKEELTEPLILLLLAVGVFYTVWGNLEDALTIFAIILILVFVEIWNEYRAKKAISALSEMASPRARVLREGKIVQVETEKVVSDDILVLTSGTRVAADSRLLLSFSLQVDESSLTGESFPQEKKVEDEVYGGTLVVSGEGEAEVYATGKNTRFGKISALAQEIKEPKTPLQIAMKALAKNLVWIALFFSVAIPLVGFARGQDLRQMVLTGLALAFATIPEEGPIIITMILGIGAYKLSQQSFLVKRIKAAEVLGSATVILTDKTGTITENKMRVVSVIPEDHEMQVGRAALATLTEMSSSPTDKAILERVKELLVEPDFGKVIRERSFGNGRKTRSLLRKVNGDLELFVSGAPEEVLSLAKGDNNRVEESLIEETAKGRRVIAFAQKTIPKEERDAPFSSLENELNFIGLISLEDPPREGVKETIRLTGQAGIKTIMVTGDHPQTAAFIAKSVGIPTEKVMTGEELDELSDQELGDVVEDVSVFARTTPEHKYRLVKALHRGKEIVAVTGDGVNDVLALKGADIGIAMGVKGTDAAREAADVVLADDNYVTIGHAVFEGRRFFDNLKKGLKYYLSAKVALILVFLVPLVLGIPFPFAPIQIIVLELFMDLAASAGFVSEPAEKTIYRRPPRNPNEKFLDPRALKGIAVSGASLFAAIMLSYFYALWQNLSVAQTETFAFTAWIIGHVILALVSRSEDEPLYSLGLFSNKIMNAWAIIAFIFLFVGTNLPGLSLQLRLSSLSISQFALILAISFVAVSWQEVRKVLLFKRNPNRLATA